MNSAHDFKNKGYCKVTSAISVELRDYITQYALFDEMQNFNSNDSQVPNAHSKYGDPAMEALLLHLHNTMEENTGLTLYPTYAYYRVYRNGDELTRHVDRPSCEISSTLCFNYSYDDAAYNWPIFMAGSSIILQPGDMAIYKGCEVEHWREPFTPPADQWHVQGFFHYVDANGPYASYKYDGRASVGEKKQALTQQSNVKSYIQFTK
jgi:hypothetical protein